MSSIINTSEYVLIDNAENTTVTPLQRTPCLTPSERAESPIMNPESNITTIPNAPSAALSYESFSRDLSLRRLNHYLESMVLALCAQDEKTESICSVKAKTLLEQLYPGDNINSLFYIRLARFLRKHSKVEWAISALEEVETGVNGKELPNLITKEARVSYWYYKALSGLEQETVQEGVEEMIKNGIVEAVGMPVEEERKNWINVGYFLTSVYFILNDDELDARFWKNLLPGGWVLPGELYSQHETLFSKFDAGVNTHIKSSPPPTAEQASRDLSQLSGLTTHDILRLDIERLKQEVHKVSDDVYVNYKETSARIKSIHTILDQKEKLESKDLDDLKKRLDYLERMTLRG